MSLGPIYFVSSHRRCLSLEGLDSVEQAVGGIAPDGYTAHVMERGAGILGRVVRIYLPDEVVSETPDARERWLEDELGAPYFSEEDRAQVVPLGETVAGDEVIWHPVHECLFLVPADGQSIRALGGDLDVAMGVLLGPRDVDMPLVFEPVHDRLEEAWWPTLGDLDADTEHPPPPPFAEVWETLLALGIHDLVHRWPDRLRGEVYVRAAGAVIAVSGEFPEVWIAYDELGSDAALEPIRAALRSFNYQDE